MIKRSRSWNREEKKLHYEAGVIKKIFCSTSVIQSFKKVAFVASATFYNLFLLSSSHSVSRSEVTLLGPPAFPTLILCNQIYSDTQSQQFKRLHKSCNFNRF